MWLLMNNIKDILAVIDKIIENQKEILSNLSRIDDMSANK